MPGSGEGPRAGGEGRGGRGGSDEGGRGGRNRTGVRSEGRTGVRWGGMIERVFDEGVMDERVFDGVFDGGTGVRWRRSWSNGCSMRGGYPYPPPTHTQLPLSTRNCKEVQLSGTPACVWGGAIGFLKFALV